LLKWCQQICLEEGINKEQQMHPIQMELNRIVDLGLPGAFAYVEDANGTSQFHTAGFADLTTRRRMTPDCRYRVGSTTKTFTAVVTLQLVAEGKLALHDTLRDRLPDLPIPNP
jgi:D-alanyl-D-alanine carboxypeptidase